MRHDRITASRHHRQIAPNKLPIDGSTFFLSALRATSPASRKKAVWIIGADYEPSHGPFPRAISKISNRFCWNFFQSG